VKTIDIITFIVPSLISISAIIISIKSNITSKCAVDIQTRAAINQETKECNDKNQAYEDANTDLLKVSTRESLEIAIESYLSIYDHACQLYQDRKLGKKSFRKAYKNDIYNLIDIGYYSKEAPFKEFYKGEEKGKFKSTWEVYCEWKKRDNKTKLGFNL